MVLSFVPSTLFCIILFSFLGKTSNQKFPLQDGTILAWRFNAAANCFDPAATLKGHTLAVVTLVVGANRLYSGSMDQSIRVCQLWICKEMCLCSC